MIEWIIICDSLSPFMVELKGLAWTRYLAMCSGEVANGIHQNYASAQHFFAGISASSWKLLQIQRQYINSHQVVNDQVQFQNMN